MNVPIQLKRSGTAGAVPSAASLENGELTLNYQDGLIHYKDTKGDLQVYTGQHKSKKPDGNRVHWCSGRTVLIPPSETPLYAGYACVGLIRLKETTRIHTIGVIVKAVSGSASGIFGIYRSTESYWLGELIKGSAAVPLAVGTSTVVLDVELPPGDYLCTLLVKNDVQLQTTANLQAMEYFGTASLTHGEVIPYFQIVQNITELPQTVNTAPSGYTASNMVDFFYTTTGVFSL